MIRACLIVLAFSLSVQAEVLATVGEEKITRDELDHRLEEVRKQTLAPPSSDQMLEEMIRLDLGVQEAEKTGLQNDPQVREAIRQVLYKALLEKKLGKKLEDVKVTDKEMRAYYKKNPEVHITHVLAEVRSDAAPIDKELARKRAVEIMLDAQKPNSAFDASANDLGFQSRLTLPKEIYEAALTMKPGEIKGPIESPFGFHVIKLVGKQDYDLADKTVIHAVLADQKRAKILEQYFGQLKKRYRVSVAPHALSAKASAQ